MMDTSNILAVIAIFLSSVLTIFSLVLGVIAYKSNAKLTQLDWIARTQKANIVVFFKSTHWTEYRFDHNHQSTRTSQSSTVSIPETKWKKYLIVKNTGNVEARNVKVSIKKTNVEQDLVNELSPISILAPGIELSFWADPFLAYDSNFVGHWSWINPDGSEDSWESHLNFA